jgi:hypothetical protein
MATDFSSVVRIVVTMLVDRDYAALERLTNSMQLTAGEIAQAVQDYGAALVMPPPTVFNELDVVEVENAKPRTWSVRHDLWAEGEGKSDLSLELTLRESANEGYVVEIDGIHVL